MSGSTSVLVVVLALAAGFANAGASVLQKLASKDTPLDESLRFKLIVDLVHRPVYLGGIAAIIASFLLQAAALNSGQLAVVQPLMATEMLFLLGILVIGFHRHVDARAWIGAAGIVIGIGGFEAIASPAGGRETASLLGWVLTAAAVAGALAVVLTAGHATRGSRRAALFGVAGAIAYALTAALVKVSVDTLTHHGVAALFASWRPYAMGVAGIGAVFLSSNAYQRGSVAAAKAALSGVDPLVSTGIGIALFGEHVRDAPVDILLEALAMLVLVAGVVVLSHSPLVREANAPDQPLADEG